MAQGYFLSIPINFPLQDSYPDALPVISSMVTSMTAVFFTVSSGKAKLLSSTLFTITPSARIFSSWSSINSAVPNPMTLRYAIPQLQGWSSFFLRTSAPGSSIAKQTLIVLFYNVQLFPLCGAVQVDVTVFITVIHGDDIGQVPVRQAEMADKRFFQDSFDLRPVCDLLVLSSHGAPPFNLPAHSFESGRSLIMLSV